MPRYKLHSPHYLNNQYHGPGAIIEWSGPPTYDMEACQACRGLPHLSELDTHLFKPAKRPWLTEEK
jgi:hypothetical protein